MSDDAGKAHRVRIVDGTEPATDAVVPVVQPKRDRYRVTAEAGLFKNGQHHEQGAAVELDERTARAFIEAGEVEAWSE